MAFAFAAVHPAANCICKSTSMPVVAQTPSCSYIHCCLHGLQPPMFPCSMASQSGLTCVLYPYLHAGSREGSFAAAAVADARLPSTAICARPCCCCRRPLPWSCCWFVTHYPHVFREEQGTLHVGLLLTFGLLCSSWPLPWSCGCAVTHYTVSCYQ